LYASLSIPGFFPAADVLGGNYFPGSAVWDIDIFSGINRCKAAGFKESDITVDSILTSAAGLATVDAKNYKTVAMGLRFLDINSFYGSMDGVLRAKFAFSQANFRCLIMPSGNLP